MSNEKGFENFVEPVLIKSGDDRVLLNGTPPIVDCRVIAEVNYQAMKAKNASMKEQVRELKEVSLELLNHWDALHPIDRETVRELYEKLRKLLTNNK